ncbi:MAG: hypothetical protein ABI340_10895 [Nitrososphaera sp.]|jgi:hypothetical protein
MDTQDNTKKFLRTQMILAIVPTFVTQLIAFYRIHKLIQGIFLEVVIFLIDLVIQMSISWPYGMILSLPITIGIPVYCVRKWTLEFIETKKGMS